MINYYKEFKGYNFIVNKGKCENIFTFDIETTSVVSLDGKIIPAIQYDNFTEDEKQNCVSLSSMYIWQMGIDDTVYFGRTWEEFIDFINYLDFLVSEKKTIYVHNLSFEFQFLRNHFEIKKMLSRSTRHVMKFELVNFNVEFRCSLILSNVSLAKLSTIYNLPVEKLKGDLDYSKIRNSKTSLTEQELKYCENDCLVLYYYIKFEKENNSKVPLTFTGHVREELKSRLDKKYRYKVKKMTSCNPILYNRMIQAFAGGYTHANFIYAGEVINNVDSYDFASSYPYVMLSEKFPMTEFKSIKLNDINKMIDSFCYILKIRLFDLKSKYFNNIISMSKCLEIKKGVYDNGRIISAKEIKIVITEVDLKLFFEFYDIKSYIIEECYFASKNYLPEKFYNFILEKYEDKTKLKGVTEKKVEYALAKNKFNSLYGMTVTNTIRDEIDFENNTWIDRPLDNIEILMKLQNEKRKGFLNFAWGVYVTAYARRNLLEILRKLDDFAIYCDTDSIKLKDGYNKAIINEYNIEVRKKLENVSGILNIDYNKYEPEDIKGKKHLIGLFEYEGNYKEFITQGAKKYCYRDCEGLHITVSGVPKSGVKDLNDDIRNFKDDLVFHFENTGKNIIQYNDDQIPFILEDDERKCARNK